MLSILNLCWSAAVRN